MTQVFELQPINGRKSFGVKCKVVVNGNKAELLSYTTIVAEFNLETKKFSVNGEYSDTTNSHIKAFKEFYGI